MKNLSRRKFLKLSGLAAAGFLSGCVTTATRAPSSNLEEKLTPQNSYKITLPESYPTEIAERFANLETVYGPDFVKEIKQLPEMCDGNFSAGDMKALDLFYEIGQKINADNNTYAKKAIEGIVKEGRDFPNADMISVPLREWYRMLADGDWGIKESIPTLEFYGETESGKYAEPGNDLPQSVLKFCSLTKWEGLDKDWQKFEQRGDIDLVRYKMGSPELIKKYVNMKYRWERDKKGRDEIQTVKEMKERGKGDCEDFANMIGYYVETLGEITGKQKNVRLVNISEKNRWGKFVRGHAFEVHEEEGEKGVYVLDGPAKEKMRKFSSAKEAGYQIAKEMKINVNRMYAMPREVFVKNFKHFPKRYSLI